jgi:hypothetical protein
MRRKNSEMTEKPFRRILKEWIKKKHTKEL